MALDFIMRVYMFLKVSTVHIVTVNLEVITGGALPFNNTPRFRFERSSMLVQTSKEKYRHSVHGKISNV